MSKINWEENEPFMSVSFSFREGNRQHNFHNEMEDGTVWRDILDDFLGFLSSCYGYDIRSEVTVSPSFLDKLSMEDDLDIEDDEQ